MPNWCEECEADPSGMCDECREAVRRQEAREETRRRHAQNNEFEGWS